MNINHQINVYSRNYSSVLSDKNTIVNSTPDTKGQVEISNEELLKQVREYYNYPVLNNERMVFLVSQPSTYVWKQEIATKSANMETPTSEEYEQSLRFLEEQMDKIMAEVARENYDLIQLAKQIEKVEFIPREKREYTQKEKELMGERGADGYAKLIYIMEAYSIRELRENPPARTYTEKQAQDLALNHSLPQEDYSVFFSHIANKLSPTQKEKIVEAIAKVQSYEEKNGAQIYNVFLKKNQTTESWEYVSLINKTFNAESIMAQYSNLASQSLMRILEQRDKLQKQNQDLKAKQALESYIAYNKDSTNSIIQTLLKDSKEAN